MMSEAVVDVPIVIVGGGGCGLNLSIFLSDFGIEHFLFEKHSDTSYLPKAHYINQRTMEIFRQHNMAERIRKVGCPIRYMGRIDWRSSLGGDGPYDRRVIGTVPAFGGTIGTPDNENYKKYSAELSSNLPLLRAEPIFRQVAEERNPGRVLFSQTVLDFEDKGDHVLVKVKSPDDKVTSYRAQYLIGADGGKTIGPKIGVQMEGPRNLVDFVSTHFKADLSKYCDDRTLITHFINPKGETMVHFDCGALVKMGPTWDRHSEEWVLHFGFPVTDSKRFETEALPSRIRQLLKLPDLEMEVLRVSHWVLERTLASKYSEGRIFIAGDAAHKRPLATGLGLNTAIEDALNLAWKLAFVVGGKASPALLDTYSLERRPIGLRNCDWGLFTFSNFPVLQAAVGLLPGEKEYNQQRFARIFEDSPYGKTARHHLARIFATQDIEFAAHNIELGFSYDTGAVVPDATRKPEEDYGGRIYNPTTRPGHRLPHVWIERDGKVISTHDLVGAGQHDFFLISDEAGKAWLDAARRISKTSNVHVGVAAIKAHRSTIDPSCFEDYDDEWAKVREFEDGGAILARPHNFVCWRSHGPSMQDGEELLRAIQAVLVERTPIDNEEAYVSVNGDNKSLVNGY